MEVILLKKVGGLGALGEKVAVRPGFGRNYLVPQGFAVPATAKNLEAFEQRRAELEQAAVESMASADARKAQLDGLTVSIARKAGDQGRLFGSVGTGDIATAITAAGIEIDKSEVRLPRGAIRAVGEFDVEIHLHADVDTTVRVEIVSLS